MKTGRAESIWKIAVSALSLMSAVLCGVYVRAVDTTIYYVALSAIAVFMTVFCAVDSEKLPHAYRSLLITVIFLSVGVYCYIAYYALGLDEKFTDFDAIKQMILDCGYFGYAVFVALTVFQVVVLPIPAAVTILMGTAIYGATVSFILSVIGTIVGSVIAFALGKVFGRRLCNFMFGTENTEKYAKILNEKGRFLFIVMLLFPAFPDDMLCMIAGITDMSYIYFIIVCTLTRPVMIGLTAYLGSGVIPFEGAGLAGWAALACLLFALFIVVTCIKKNFESKREFSEFSDKRS